MSSLENALLLTAAERAGVLEHGFTIRPHPRFSSYNSFKSVTI